MYNKTTIFGTKHRKEPKHECKCKKHDRLWTRRAYRRGKKVYGGNETVNHRYNDMTIKLPRSLAGLEDKIKKESCMRCFRGKTDVYISFETFSAADVEVN